MGREVRYVVLQARRDGDSDRRWTEYWSQLFPAVSGVAAFGWSSFGGGPSGTWTSGGGPNGIAGACARGASGGGASGMIGGGISGTIGGGASGTIGGSAWFGGKTGGSPVGIGWRLAVALWSCRGGARVLRLLGGDGGGVSRICIFHPLFLVRAEL